MKYLKYNFLFLSSALAIGFMLSAASCNSNSSPACQSSKIGDQSLHSSSKEYINLSNESNVLFRASSGDQMIFTKRTEHQLNGRICVDFLCENTSDPFQQTPCKYYEVESYNNIYLSLDSSLIIQIGVYVDLFERETTRFYDGFRAHMSAVGPFTEGQTVIYKHDPTIDASAVPNPYQPLQFSNQITINNQVFQNVYTTSDSQTHQLVIQRNAGLIAIKFDGVYYVKQ